MGTGDTRKEDKHERLEVVLQSARSLLEQAEKSARDQRLLANASVELSVSLDYRATLQKVARLVVADFAEWCFVDVLEDGRVRDVAVAHMDPVKEALARSLVRKLPQLPTAPHGVVRVIRTLEPELHDGEHPAASLDSHLPVEYPEALRELGARSYICAPLLARQRAIGAITYVRGQTQAPYSAADLELAVELAHRAAIAIENAMLHERLADAVRDRDDLVAFLAHDLRNLLGTITGTSEQLLRKGIGPVTPGLERIQRSAERMSRLINDILDVSRIERGVLEVDRQDRDAEAIISDAIDAAWSNARAKEIDLKAQVASGLRVYCDPTRVFQVVFNLLDNAIKFSPARSTIVVHVAAVDSQVTFSVSDSGPGIPEQDLPRVFERFWHGRQQRRAGAGLGLAIAKGIVEAHGGRIWAESTPGKGTTLCFTLPRTGEGQSVSQLH